MPVLIIRYEIVPFKENIRPCKILFLLSPDGILIFRNILAKVFTGKTLPLTKHSFFLHGSSYVLVSLLTHAIPNSREYQRMPPNATKCQRIPTNITNKAGYTSTHAAVPYRTCILPIREGSATSLPVNRVRDFEIPRFHRISRFLRLREY